MRADMKIALFLFLTALSGPGLAQTAPSLVEIAAY